MQTNLNMLAVTEPVALGLGAATLLVVIFVAFKVAKVVMKMILMLAALAALGLAVWWWVGTH